ncbi:MAG: hypothetical protein ACRDWY_05185 [Actinomycetes bacterium]
MNGFRRAAEVLLGVLISMVLTTRVAAAKGYIERDESVPRSPRAVEGPTEVPNTAGGGSAPDVSSSLADEGYSLAQLITVTALTVALALAIAFMAQRAFRHHRAVRTS